MCKFDFSKFNIVEFNNKLSQLIKKEDDIGMMLIVDWAKFRCSPSYETILIELNEDITIALDLSEFNNEKREKLELYLKSDLSIDLSVVAMKKLIIAMEKIKEIINNNLKLLFP